VAHVVPQLPQLPLSVLRSAQRPLQRVEPVGHSATQTPLPLHVGVAAGQALPQAPQLLLSVLMSTQMLLPETVQSVEKVGHVAAQLPLLQSGVAAGQTCPQLPQLLASTSVLTHVPSQLSVVEADAQHTLPAPMPLESDLEVSPLEHEATHLPPLHVGVAPEQAWPHPPQLPLSVIVSTQTPLHRTEPVGHEFTQLPPLHVGVAAGQTCPQLPQLLASTCVSAHVPSQLSVVLAAAQQIVAASMPLESVLADSPLGQDTLQAPLLQ